MHELIGDITFSILFAWGLGLLAHFTRQPLILAYLVAGFFIGPFGMGWVKSQESISVISELYGTFLRRGHWYMLPLLVVMLAIGMLLVVAASSPFVAPFIYTLF